MILRLGLLTVAFAACAGPNHEIVEDRFDLSETSSSPEVTEVVDVGGGDVALSGNLGDAESRRGRGDRRDALDSRARLRPPAGRDGRRAARGRARADARRRHRRARAAGDAVGFAAGRGEQRGGPRRAADRGPALRGGAGAGRRARSAGRSSAPTGRSPRARRRCAARAGWRCRRTAAPPTSPKRRDRSCSVVEMPAPGGPKVVYRLDLGNDPVVALAAAGAGAGAGGRAREAT